MPSTGRDLLITAADDYHRGMIAWSRLARGASVARAASAGELWFSARAWLLAPIVEGALAALGVRPVLRWIGRIEQPGIAARGAAAVPVAEGARWVDRAYAVHLVRGRCLPRAALQHALHRMDGTPSRLVIGVRRDDAATSLDAHAWVEDPTTTPDRAFADILVLDGSDLRAGGP